MPLTNSQYNALMRVYEEKRAKSRDLANLHYEHACQKVPELASIDASISSASLDQAKKLLAGDDTALASLKEDIRSLSDRRRRLLSDAGFPEDYLEQHFECPDCQDTGFIGGEKCHCFKKMQMQFIYQQSHLGRIVRTQNFDHFDLTRFDDRELIDGAGGKTNRQYMAEVRNLLLDWTQNFDERHGNVILMGNPGTGKTFLINCVAKALMDSYHSVIYFTSTDLFDSFSRALRHDVEEQEETEDAILNCDLLVIDDLGTEMNNSYTTSRLFYVLNQRMVLHKSVMISTNLNFRAMQDRYSDRIVSRIMAEYDYIPLYGVDQRLR